MTGALGESVGINYVAAKDKAVLIRHLRGVRGPGLLRARHRDSRSPHDGLEVTPVDISDLFAVEVDFEEDLERANAR